MCLKGWSIFLWCTTIFALPVWPQPTHVERSDTDYVTRNIDNASGLNSNDVYALTQDQKGYMWIATEKGLLRYDGIRFMDCFKNAVRPGSLIVSDLFADDAHNRILYLQPDNKLRQWGCLTNTATEVTFGQGSAAERTYAYGKKTAWVFREYWVDSSKGEGLILMRRVGEKLDRPAFFLRERQGGKTWVVDADDGLLLLDDDKKCVYSASNNPVGDPLLSQLQHLPASIRKITADSHGNIWLISWSQNFYRFDKRSGRLFTYSLAEILDQEGNASTLPGWVSAILEDDHGVLWLATAKAGLLRYDERTDKFAFFLRRPHDNLGLQYNHQINAIFQDREQNIWLATDKGINIFNPYRQYFTALNNQDSGESSMAISEISGALLTGSNELWVGTWGGGIKVYDKDRHLKRHFFFKGQYEQNLVWSFLQQEDGTMWAGCQHGYIHEIDPAGRVVRTIHPVELQDRTVKCMIKDTAGNALLGLHSGKIVVYDKRRRRFIAPIPSSVPFSPIESLYVDGNDRCWAGTWNGLAEFDTRKNCFVGVYRPQPGSDIRCWGVSAYNDSVLIVGTENNGLYFFNQRSKTFDKILVNEEQPHTSVHAVTADAGGKIWFSTDFAICNYDPLTRKCFVHQPEKGLINTSFSSSVFLGSPAGKLITWTSAEIVAFLPAQISALQHRTSAVTITGFRVFSDPLFIDTLLIRRQPVSLSYKENFIGIEFSNLQYSGIERTKYYYRLDGVDPGWVYGGTRGSANYTNLSPGDYTFHVRTENADNEKQMAALSIHIAAPYWATTWFRLLFAAVVILVVFLLIRWYSRALKQEAGMKQQMAETEMMALRAQMNPHFIFNCINNIDALIQCDDKYQATVYLNKFARLIRNILDSSKQPTIPLERDLETLRLYIDMERFRSEDRFTAEIRVDEQLLMEDCRVPPLIVQPYVENAILHGLRNLQGGSGKLIIQVSREDEYLVYRIEDNGVGRAAVRNRTQHRSYGMEMSRDRVNLFNREQHLPVVITDLQLDGRPAGTRVQVSLKMKG